MKTLLGSICLVLFLVGPSTQLNIPHNNEPRTTIIDNNQGPRDIATIAEYLPFGWGNNFTTTPAPVPAQATVPGQGSAPVPAAAAAQAPASAPVPAPAPAPIPAPVPAPSQAPAQAQGARMIHIQNHNHNPISPTETQVNKRQQHVQVNFSPTTANGASLPPGSPQAGPQIVGTIPMPQKNQVDTDLAHMMVDKNGQPVRLKDIKINPQEIQFTVPNEPDSTGLAIIEQIRAQLGSTPVTLEELNNKFVTFTATTPGVMINRTIVTSVVDNQTDITKTTRTTQVRIPQQGTSRYESYSTQYPPILSYDFNPVAPRSYEQLYGSQEYEYKVPQNISYQSQPQATYQQTQTQSNYQQPQATYQQTQTQSSYSQPAAQPPYNQQQQSSQAYQTQTQTQSYTTTKQQQPYQQQQTKTTTYQAQPQAQSYQQPEQPVKIVYVEVCSTPQQNLYKPSPAPVQQPSYGQSSSSQYSTPSSYSAPSQSSSYSSPSPSSYSSPSPSNYQQNPLGTLTSLLGPKLGGEVTETQQQAEDGLQKGYAELANAQKIIQEISSQLGQWQSYATQLQQPYQVPSYSAPPAPVYSQPQPSYNQQQQSSYTTTYSQPQPVYQQQQPKSSGYSQKSSSGASSTTYQVSNEHAASQAYAKSQPVVYSAPTYSAPTYSAPTYTPAPAPAPVQNYQNSQPSYQQSSSSSYSSTPQYQAQQSYSSSYQQSGSPQLKVQYHKSTEKTQVNHTLPDVVVTSYGGGGGY